MGKRGKIDKKAARALSSKLGNLQMLNSKRSFELAISTLVVIVLAILVLIAVALAFTGGWKKFIDVIKGYSIGEADSIAKLCESQCKLENKNSFCCEEKKLGKENITCLDDRVKVECGIDCRVVC